MICSCPRSEMKENFQIYLQKLFTRHSMQEILTERGKWTWGLTWCASAKEKVSHLLLPTALFEVKNLEKEKNWLNYETPVFQRNEPSIVHLCHERGGG